jgi:SEC-C motif-containing protein
MRHLNKRNKMECPCGSKLPYEACCGALISGEKEAASPEALMRSRYTAYTVGNGAYLVATTVAQKRFDEDVPLIEEFAEKTEWLGLAVIRSHENGDEGEVEFKAYYRENGGIGIHHELSRFVKVEGRWYYDEGRLFETKIGRNDPCPCGSGKKYKKCCGAN